MFMGRGETLTNDGFTYFLETNIPPPSSNLKLQAFEVTFCLSENKLENLLVGVFFVSLCSCVPSCHFCSELKRDLICHCSCLLGLSTLMSAHGSYNAATLNHLSQSVWTMRDGYGREIAFHLFRPPV